MKVFVQLFTHPDQSTGYRVVTDNGPVDNAEFDSFSAAALHAIMEGYYLTEKGGNYER